MRKTCLIFNAAAGTAGGWTEWLQEQTAYHRLLYLPAKQPGEVQRLAARAVADGYQRLIAAGGDGTISQVVNGIAQHLQDVELGVVPLGTGNDLARALHIPLDNMEQALEIASEAPAALIDLMRICGPTAQYSVNAATGGVGGKVARDVDPHDKARWGSFAYWLTAVSKLMDPREYQVRLEVDNQIEELSLYGLVIANGPFIGGGFPIAPQASLIDGLLNVTIVPVLPTLELLATGLNFTLGRPASERIRTFTARRVHIVSQPEMHFSVDGEPIQAIDTTFEVMPGALRVARPPMSASRG